MEEKSKEEKSREEKFKESKEEVERLKGFVDSWLMQAEQWLEAEEESQKSVCMNMLWGRSYQMNWQLAKVSCKLEYLHGSLRPRYF
jgi:hypothetical protein